MIKSLIIATLMVAIANFSVFANDAQTVPTKTVRGFKQDGKNTSLITVTVPETFTAKEIEKTLKQHEKIREHHAEIQQYHAEIQQHHAEIRKQHAEIQRQHAEARQQQAEARQQHAEARAESMSQQREITGQNNEEARAARRVEMQLRRLAEEFQLTEEQLEEAKKLFVDYENRQNELRTKINELNIEKMEKFDELLTEEQKQLRSEGRNRRTPSLAPAELNDARAIRLNALPELKTEDENTETEASGSE